MDYKELNIRYKAMKLLEGNTANKLLDIGLGNHFLIWHQKQWSKDKQAGIKWKSLGTAKETNKMKRQPTK